MKIHNRDANYGRGESDRYGRWPAFCGEMAHLGETVACWCLDKVSCKRCLAKYWKQWKRPKK